jgi:hypothetical protein
MNAQDQKKTRPRIGVRETPLNKLQRKGQLLQGPLKQLPVYALSSWVNDILPEVLWSALLVSALPSGLTLTFASPV